MAHRFATSIRTARAQAIIDAAGAGAKWKHYDGTKPATLGGTPAGTLLATHTCGSVMGTAASGVLTLDIANYSNVAGSNVSGTQTFARLETSGGTPVWDVDYGVGSANIQSTGDVVGGQAFAFGTSTLTMPNA